MRLRRISGLEGFTKSFYEEGGDNRSPILTLQNFAATGLAASEWLINEGLSETRAFQDCGGRDRLPGVLLVPVARTGLAVCPKAVWKYWQEKLRSVPVLAAYVGASRPENPQTSPAGIYSHSLDNLPQQNWQNWVVVIFEYGLATASTAEAVIGLIRRKLGVADANIIFFANCACIHQSRPRLETISEKAILAYGTRWSYELDTFYLRTLIKPDGGWWWVKPQDWGRRAFGDDITNFVALAKAMFPESLFTPKNEAEIRTHFALLKKEK